MLKLHAIELIVREDEDALVLVQRAKDIAEYYDEERFAESRGDVDNQVILLGG